MHLEGIWLMAVEKWPSPNGTFTLLSYPAAAQCSLGKQVPNEAQSELAYSSLALSSTH